MLLQMLTIADYGGLRPDRTLDLIRAGQVAIMVPDARPVITRSIAFQLLFTAHELDGVSRTVRLIIKAPNGESVGSVEAGLDLPAIDLTVDPEDGDVARFPTAAAYSVALEFEESGEYLLELHLDDETIGSHRFVVLRVPTPEFPAVEVVGQSNQQ